jgi:hypothetical protein
MFVMPHYFLRQVHPNMLNKHELTSLAFLPSPKDLGKLSGYDGKKITPADSYSHYTNTYNLISKGVWGVKKNEILTTGLQTYPEPQTNSLYHAVIDFNSAQKKNWRNLARKLKYYAIEHGCLYS